MEREKQEPDCRLQQTQLYTRATSPGSTTFVLLPPFSFALVHLELDGSDEGAGLLYRQ